MVQGWCLISLASSQGQQEFLKLSPISATQCWKAPSITAEHLNGPTECRPKVLEFKKFSYVKCFNLLFLKLIVLIKVSVLRLVPVDLLWRAGQVSLRTTYFSTCVLLVMNLPSPGTSPCHARNPLPHRTLSSGVDGWLISWPQRTLCVHFHCKFSSTCLPLWTVGSFRQGTALHYVSTPRTFQCAGNKGIFSKYLLTEWVSEQWIFPLFAPVTKAFFQCPPIRISKWPLTRDLSVSPTTFLSERDHLLRFSCPVPTLYTGNFVVERRVLFNSWALHHEDSPPDMGLTHHPDTLTLDVL